MIKCKKCGAVFGKQPNVCFYCGANDFEEVETIVEETKKEEKIKQEEVPKKKSRKKKGTK